MSGREEQVTVTKLEQLAPGDVVVKVSGQQFGWEIIEVRVSRKHGAPIAIPTESPEWGEAMPWKLRWLYAWRALAGRVRVAQDSIDASRLESDGFLEGTIRVQMTPGKVIV